MVHRPSERPQGGRGLSLSCGRYSVDADREGIIQTPSKKGRLRLSKSRHAKPRAAGYLGVTGDPLLALKGPNRLAQGNALGIKVPGQGLALKGRNTLLAKLLCPFRAKTLWENGASQGVALGWHVRPFQGHERNTGYAQIFHGRPAAARAGRSARTPTSAICEPAPAAPRGSAAR